MATNIPFAWQQLDEPIAPLVYERVELINAMTAKLSSRSLTPTSVNKLFGDVFA